VVIANDHYQSIGIVCLSVIRGHSKCCASALIFGCCDSYMEQSASACHHLWIHKFVNIMFNCFAEHWFHSLCCCTVCSLPYFTRFIHRERNVLVVFCIYYASNETSACLFDDARIISAVMVVITQWSLWEHLAPFIILLVYVSIFRGSL